MTTSVRWTAQCWLLDTYNQEPTVDLMWVITLWQWPSLKLDTTDGKAYLPPSHRSTRELREASSWQAVVDEMLERKKKMQLIFHLFVLTNEKPLSLKNPNTHLWVQKKLVRTCALRPALASQGWTEETFWMQHIFNNLKQVHTGF